MTRANTHPGTHREQRESVTLSKFRGKSTSWRTQRGGCLRSKLATSTLGRTWEPDGVREMAAFGARQPFATGSAKVGNPYPQQSVYLRADCGFGSTAEIYSLGGSVTPRLRKPTRTQVIQVVSGVPLL